MQTQKVSKVPPFDGNKLNSPLPGLEEYRILPYSLINISEDARVKQH